MSIISNTQWTSPEDIQNAKYENPAYWNMMDPELGPDRVVSQLLGLLPKTSRVFEYGAGRGRNVIPLALAWHIVTAQDIAKKPLENLANTAEAQNLDIYIRHSNAVDDMPDEKYDALICIRVLHFTAKEDGWGVIQNMQNSTADDGYNALVLFIPPTRFLEEYFCPTVEELKEKYTGWEIMYQEIETSEPTATSNGKSMTRVNILFRKNK